MSCAELRDLLLLVATGAADDDEARRVIEHLQTGCPRCLGRYAEAEAIATQLALSVEPVEPSPAVRQGLLARVAATASIGAPRAAAEPAKLERAGGAGRSMAPWLAAAAALALVALGVQLFESRVAKLDLQLEARAVALERSRAEVAERSGELAAAVTALERLGRPQTEVVSLAGTEPQPGAAARVFWDRETGEWRLYAADLRPLPADRTYELWAITEDGAKLPVGIFDVDESGSGSLVVRLEGIEGAVVAAAVTDEPAGGTDAPTGTIHLLGKLQPTAS